MPGRHSAKLIWNSKDDAVPYYWPEDNIMTEEQWVFPSPIPEENSLFGESSPGYVTNPAKPVNRLFYGDNLVVLQHLVQNGYKESLDLIYIDPPYLSDSKYVSRVPVESGTKVKLLERQVFNDTWDQGIDSYLDQLLPRLVLMRELLSPRGSLFIHLDWHVSHYVKVLMDEIFSGDNFINEIIWCYGGGSGTKKHFHRKHDIILWYAKGHDYIFNPQYRPYTSGTLQRGLTKVKGDKYCLHKEGALMQDWWTDINKILSPTARENLKFPTQKPVSLLERIVASASLPDSIVADFYAGAGTTAQAGERMKRHWIICDSSAVAVQTSLKRMIEIGASPFSIENWGERRSVNNQLLLHPPEIIRCDNETNLLNIGIKDYIPDKDKLTIIEPDYDFKSLIDFWEIDLDYKEVFISVIQVRRKHQHYDQSIPINVRVLIPVKPTYKIAIKVYDVFGDYITRIFDIN